MSNDLSDLAPTAYSAAKEVAAEPWGAVAAINMDFADQGVAVGDTVDVPVAPSRTASDFTPNNVTSTGSDADAADIPVSITKSRKVDWHLTGEQIRRLENGGTNQDWIKQLLAQGMRTLRNEAEVDCCLALKVGASRAAGTAGTTPFGSNLGALTAARKILQDNGAPLADLQAVVDSDAGLNLRNLGLITDADKAGSDEERRSGNFKRQYGFMLTESAGIATHTKGTGSAYQLSAAGSAADTSVAVDTGTGTLLAGDVVTVSGDGNSYVANSALSGGSFTIGRPGLLAAAADNTAIAIGNSYAANLAFERSACVGIMRPPLMPANPTIQQLLVSDQFGMTYLMLDIAQYGQRTWELHLAWGFKAVNSEFISVIMG